MNRRPWKNRWLVVAGFLLSAIFLWLAFRRVSAQTLATAFSNIRPFYVLVCAGSLLAGVLLRALRWRVVSGQPPAQQREFARATNLGVLANLIFPARAGEFVRVMTLGRRLRVPLAMPVASASFDRLIDVIVLVASASVLYYILPVSEALGRLLQSLLAVGCVIAIALVLYARSAGVGAEFISRITVWLLRRWPLDPEAFLSELRREFRRLIHGWLSVEVVLVAMLVLCADYGAVAALLRAFDLSLPLEAPLALWVFLAAGSALPSAPGYVGVYQVAAVWALSSYSVSAPVAVAVATVLQVATLAVALLMAGPSAFSIFRQTFSGRRMA